MYSYNWVTLHSGFEVPKYIREKVFMQEQGFSLEFDETDSRCMHLAVTENNEPVACLRLFRDTGNRFIIGRIAVLPQYRGKGIGQLCVQEAEQKAIRLGATSIELSAQSRVQDFYAKMGYLPYGEEYLDEHTPHIHMCKQLQAPEFTVNWLAPGEDIAPALEVRKLVFGQEFGYTNDPDEFDRDSHTLVISKDGAPVGCGRVLVLEPGLCKLGKIAVLKSLRGSGLGLLVMENLFFKALELGAEEITLSAQLVAKGFYEKLGLCAYGSEFLIQGKGHINMKKKL